MWRLYAQALSVVGALWDDQYDPCIINRRIIYIHNMNVPANLPKIGAVASPCP